MKNCLFCKIVKGEIPCFKVWEDDQFLAFLDIYPNTEGVTLVVPKDHYPSLLTQVPDEVFQSFWLAAKKVAQLLEKKLGVERVGLVVEGVGVDHAHIKLYPFHGKETLQESGKTVYYKKYPGFIDTRGGPEASPEKLKKLAEKIRQ